MSSRALSVILCSLLLLSCFGKKGSDSPSSSPSVTGSESGPAECSSTPDSNWNQSVVLKGEGTIATSQNITLLLSARHANRVAGYFISERLETPSLSDPSWVLVTPVSEYSGEVASVLSPGDGNKTVHVWFKEGDNNLSPVTCLTLTLSTQRPAGAITINNGDTATDDLSVTVRLTGSSRIKITHYMLSEDGAVPSSDSPLWNPLLEPKGSVEIETDFTLIPSVGAHTIYGWVKNEAGQISESVLDTIDLAAIELTAGLTINNNARYTAMRNLSLGLSGLSSTTITGYLVSETIASAPSPFDASWTAIESPSASLQKTVNLELSPGDRLKTVYLHLKDSLNRTGTTSGTITLDANPPTGGLRLDDGNKLTVDSTVSADMTGTDSIGITAYYLSSDSTPPDLNDGNWISISSTTSLSTSSSRNLTDLRGLSTQYLWLKDAAGNISPTISDGIEVVKIYSTSPNTNNHGQYSSITVDSSGKAYISSYQANAPRLSLWNLTNGALIHLPVDESADVGIGTSIAIDSNDKLHIAYRDATNGTLRYATNASGIWVNERVEAGGFSPSIAVDSSGAVHIAHWIEGSGYVRYVTGSSGAWSSQIIPFDRGIEEPSLTIGPNNRVHIAAHSNVRPSSLQYATNVSGSWAVEVVQSGNNTGLSPSITVSDDAKVIIAYWENGDIYVASKNGSNWEGELVDTTSGDPIAVAVDSQGFVHLVYYEDSIGTNNLRYVTNLSGDWVATTLDSAGDVGNYCDIAIDSNDRLHISYYDATNGDLKYLTTAD
ncbi:MAG: hypothetical protein HYT77_04100 [Deltaproteobacteria bacterium]|nr:hypothetical protein [Deltaproteobacteria bacterium]